ncbi:hypothetical protein ACKVWC_011361 [Pyricularia oryzae]
MLAVLIAGFAGAWLILNCLPKVLELFSFSNWNNPFTTLYSSSMAEVEPSTLEELGFGRFPDVGGGFHADLATLLHKLDVKTFLSTSKAQNLLIRAALDMDNFTFQTMVHISSLHDSWGTAFGWACATSSVIRLDQKSQTKSGEGVGWSKASLTVPIINRRVQELADIAADTETHFSNLNSLLSRSSNAIGDFQSRFCRDFIGGFEEEYINVLNRKTNELHSAYKTLDGEKAKAATSKDGGRKAIIQELENEVEIVKQEWKNHHTRLSLHRLICSSSNILTEEVRRLCGLLEPKGNGDGISAVMNLKTCVGDIAKSIGKRNMYTESNWLDRLWAICTGSLKNTRNYTLEQELAGKLGFCTDRFTEATRKWFSDNKMA